MKKLCKFSIILVTTLAISMVGTACSDGSDGDGRMDNQAFVTEASSSNNFEIAAGNLAVNKGVNQEVKAYGSHMVQDHTAVGTEMTNLARSKGWTVPTNLLQKHKTHLDRLQALSGAAFDREFAALMVSSHQEAVDLFTRASDDEDGVRDNELRQFAAAKLPNLKMHLDEAEELEAEVND